MVSLVPLLVCVACDAKPSGAAASAQPLVEDAHNALCMRKCQKLRSCNEATRARERETVPRSEAESERIEAMDAKIVFYCEQACRGPLPDDEKRRLRQLESCLSLDCAAYRDCKRERYNIQ